MKIKKTLSILLVVFVCSISAFSQRYISGTVTKVIDGRTIVIQDKPNSQITIQLQAIAVPDAEQPLAATVKEHLEKLLLGKAIGFQMKSVKSGKVLLGMLT